MGGAKNKNPISNLGFLISGKAVNHFAKIPIGFPPAVSPD
jgi:hypothetical protein